MEAKEETITIPDKKLGVPVVPIPGFASGSMWVFHMCGLLLWG